MQRSIVYRPEVDGLRALAVIAVIVHHFDRAILPSGYLGVDIFFVISGYVIMGSFAHRPYASFEDLLIEFYTRRVKRLLPTLVLCIVITAVLACLFDPKPATSLRTGLYALFGISNIYLLSSATNYFAQSTDLNVFTHTWSLGVEEQFYFLFPALVWFTGFRPQIANSGRVLIRTLIILCIISIASFLFLNAYNQPAAYFLMPTRLWELGIGCLLFLLQRRARIACLLQGISPTPVLMLLLAALFLPIAYTVEATVIVVGLTTLLIGCLRQGTTARVVLTCPPMVYIGLISYSLYLWHWSVLSISRWTIGIHTWSVPLLLAVMLLLAIGSYHLVETPLRRATWSRIRLRSLSYGVCTAIAAAGIVTILAIPLKGRLYLGDRALAIESPVSAILQSSWIKKRDKQSLQLSQDIRNCNMTPHHLRGAAYAPKPAVDKKFIRRCTRVIAAETRPKLLLVGDSFANVIAKHLALASSSIGYEFKFLFGYGCPYPLPFRDLKSKARKACAEVDEDFLEKEIIDGLAPGDIVVIRLHYAKKQYLRYSNNRPPPVDGYDACQATPGFDPFAPRRTDPPFVGLDLVADAGLLSRPLRRFSLRR